MYKVTHEGKSITLDDRDYNQLLMRFDPARFEKEEPYDWYTNYVACICNWYKCHVCPLRVEPAQGCMSLLHHIIGHDTRDLSFLVGAIYTHKQGLIKIQKVHDVLTAAEKV